MEFTCREIAETALPGQFVHIRVAELDPLLRRPFSIHDVEGDRVRIVYDVVGRGTRILSNVGSGKSVDVLGPLGNGFLLDGETFCMVAGGMGVAPMVFLARRLREKTERVIAFVGAGSKAQLIGDSKIRALGIEVFTATEDGSVGYGGLITDLFSKVVERRELENLAVLACGPKEMLKVVAGISEKIGAMAQGSLEELMACGMGACLGCAVAVRSGEYKMVCKDGPVFNLSEVAIDG
jgi:dihydroorotate dehydrogenase electron transfer subunit